MAAIANTTRTETAPRVRRRRDAGTVLLGGLVGLLLVGLALPQTVGQLTALGGDPLVSAIRAGRPLPLDELDRLIENREAALAWVDEGRLWHDLGLARLARSQALPFREPEARLAALEAARAALLEAVARRPLDSHAWLRLSLTELLLLQRDAAARALESSLRAAPAQPDQFAGRLELGLKLWDRLSDEGRALWAQQARLLWRDDPRRLAMLVRRLGGRERFEAALALEPEAVPGLDALLRR